MNSKIFAYPAKNGLMHSRPFRLLPGAHFRSRSSVLGNHRNDWGNHGPTDCKFENLIALWTLDFLTVTVDF